MKLQQIICDKFSIGLFLAMFFLTLPLIAAAQEKIAFSSDRDGNSEIYVMNPDGSNQTRLTNNPGNDFKPSLNADGSKIAFESWRDGNPEIYVMNADSSNQTRLTNNPALDDFPAVNYDGEPSINADGSKIVFTSRRDGNFEIYVMNGDGSNQTNLTNNAGFDFEPSFSPNGNQIAFVSSRDGNPEIYVMNADGSNLSRLTNNPAIDSDPAFSPDGSQLAFRSNRDGGNHEIYVMNSDGSNQTNLTTNAALDLEPSFSPNGNQIAFVSRRDGNQEIYVMNADGSNQMRLTNNPAIDSDPSWRGEAGIPTPTPTVTPTPGNICTPSTTVTEGDLFPGGIVSFGVASGPGTVTIDHVNAGTGLQSLTVVGVPVNAAINLPAFVPGSFAPQVVTFAPLIPGLAIDFTLRAASTFHAANIRVRCMQVCQPTTTVMEGDLFPGGIVSFGVGDGPGAVSIDHVNAGTGLQSLTVVGVPVNANVNIPAFMPGTTAPIAVTFTEINPALNVDFTLRAASAFHAINIRVRCGTQSNKPEN